jgi:hypothetical protein
MRRILMIQYKQIKLGEFILASKFSEKYELFLLLRDLTDDIKYAVKFDFPINYPLAMPELTCLSINRKYKIGEKICLGEEHKDTMLEYIYLFMSKNASEPDKFPIKKSIIDDNIREISDIIFDI